MRRILFALVLGVAVACGADAATPPPPLHGGIETPGSTNVKLSLPLSTPGCYASGTFGLNITRGGNAAESIQNATPVSCAASTLRVGDQGLLVESIRSNFISTPDAPPAAPAPNLTAAQPYTLRVEGAGNYLADFTGTATGTGLPCTASAGSPCKFTVATTGTVNLTRTGALSFAQLENGGTTAPAPWNVWTSRFHFNSSRAADAVTIPTHPLAAGPWCVAFDGATFDAQAWQSTDSRGFFDWISGTNRVTAFMSNTDNYLKFYVTHNYPTLLTYISWVFLSNIPHEFRFGHDNAGATQANGALWIDGEQVVLDTPSGAGDGIVNAFGPVDLGQSFGLYLNGYMKNVRFAKRCDALPVPSFTVNLVSNSLAAVGDSITGTVFGDVPTNAYPNLVYGSLGWTGGFLNAALSGRRTDQVRGIYGGGVRRQGHANLIYMAGINDIVFYGKTVDFAFSNLTYTVNQARSQGTRVVLLNLLPFGGNLNWNPTREAQRIDLNSRIATLCNPPGVTCVDAASDFVDVDGTTMKAAYSGDGLHPNLTGHQRLRDLVLSVFP